MTSSASFRVLIATDGSSSADAALITAVGFPWPAGNSAQGVIVPAGVPALALGEARRISASATQKLAVATQRKLAERWPDARVVTPTGPVADAILAAAASVRANVIVVGWRGHGRFRRLLVGSVSRDVLRRAGVPVLVVRHALPRIRRAVIGFDGSQEGARGVRFLARCGSPKDGTVTLITVVTPFVSPGPALLPAEFRSQLRAEIAAHNANRRRLAMETLEKAAANLKQSGWRVRAIVRDGAPLYELMRLVTEADADLVIVGARGCGRLGPGSIGSVTEGVLTRCHAPVLVVP